MTNIVVNNLMTYHWNVDHLVEAYTFHSSPVSTLLKTAHSVRFFRQHTSQMRWKMAIYITQETDIQLQDQYLLFSLQRSWSAQTIKCREGENQMMPSSTNHFSISKQQTPKNITSISKGNYLLQLWSLEVFETVQ